MLYNIEIRGDVYAIDSNSIIAFHSDSGHLYMYVDVDSNSAVLDIIGSGEYKTEITDPTFYNLIGSTSDSHMINFGQYIINCSKVECLKEVDASNTNLIYHSGLVLTIPYNIDDLKAGINAKNGDTNHFVTIDEDFISGVGGTNLVQVMSGGGATTSKKSTSEPNRICITSLSTGTTASGRVYVGSSQYSIIPTRGEMMYETAVSLSALANTTDKYAVELGYTTSPSSSAQSSGVYFLYDKYGSVSGSTSSDYWQIMCVRNNVVTNYVTSILVSTTGWAKLKIIINDDATIAYYYINEEFAYATDVNIPYDKQLQFGVFIGKTLGTTACTLDVDYIRITKLLYDSI